MTPLETILSNIQNVKVIDESIDYSQYIPLNLSSTNEVLAKIEITNSTHFEKFIEDYLAENNAKVAFGSF